MRLLHYSAKPFLFDPAQRYRNDIGPRYKPEGLWVSVAGDDDWKSWCEGEQWRLNALKHAVEIVVAPSVNLLRIETLGELDRFHQRFATDQKLGGISWSEVSALFDGIIIAPYRWERRHTFLWYYGWDCASGAIWNLNGVEVMPFEKVAA